ncbi:MAG: cyclic nucleotide-binding domain-containing protein [Acidimicrobiia bacterium]|nr:cyclic nucleotide-binding domain-containing protein [Acidimicrobiia bacterium]
MSGAPDRARTADLMANISPFDALSPGRLEELAATVTERHLERGEILIREGEQGNSVFVVVSGRLRAYVHDGNETPVVVGEISAGESVGEMALLSDHPRSASVRAVRESRLIELNREAFHDLIADDPTALTSLTRTIVERLSRSIHHSAATGRIRTIAILAAGQTTDVNRAAAELADELAAHGSVTTVGRAETDASPAMTFSRRVRDLESQYDKILMIGDPESPEWTHECIGQADRVLLIAEADSSPRLNPIESELLAHADRDARARMDLVIIHRAAQTMPARVEKWQQDRPGVRCFNLRQDSNLGFPRLARILQGKAVNLVLSGGGARGLAHIGVLKALEEASIQVDVVGGASFGSITAGMIAMGRGWEETRDEVVRHLLGSGSPVDVTAPLIALARGARVRQQLVGTFGDTTIENLWLPFFCVSSNLTHGEVQVHRSGPLWQAVRSSISIPGVFPPVRSPDGDVLVDGAVMNNLPVDVMQAFGEPGPILAVNLRSPVDMAAHDLPHDGAVSGWQALRRRFSPWHRDSAMPGIAEILLRTSEIGSVISSRTFESRADLVFHPPVGDYALMDFSRIDDLIEVGYRHAAAVLEENSQVALESHPLLADRDRGSQR